MIRNHIDIYQDGILIDGHEVRVKRDPFSVQPPANGEVLSVSVEIVPDTMTMHLTNMPGGVEAVNLKKDDEADEKVHDAEERLGSARNDAPSVGTAYIDIHPRFMFPEDEIISLLEKISDMLDGMDISVTKR